MAISKVVVMYRKKCVPKYGSGKTCMWSPLPHRLGLSQKKQRTGKGRPCGELLPVRAEELATSVEGRIAPLVGGGAGEGMTRETAAHLQVQQY